MAITYLSGERIQGSSGLIFDAPDADNSNLTQSSQYAGGRDYRGQCFQTGHSMIGKIPQKVIVSLAKIGSPTGNMEVVIVKADNSEILIEAKNIATEFTTTITSHTFTNLSQSYALQNNDGIFIKFADSSGTNDSTNALRAYVGYNGITGTTYAYHNYSPASWARTDAAANQPMVVYAQADKATITNVPLQTQFEETDTRKQYSYLYPSGTGDKTWIEMGTAGALTRTYGYTLLWQHTGKSIDSVIDGSGGENEGLGERWTTGDTAVLGNVVNKVEVKLKVASGTPASTLTCAVIKADGTQITIGTMSASELTASYVTYPFINNDNTYTMTNGDGIGFTYPYSDGAINVGVETDAGSNSDTIYVSTLNGAWSDIAGMETTIQGVYEAY